ncbi:unnamed protein product [Ambrosiozyma monospora]|uniref:Unnamed protein product n=1 Tax=Ambrosiozyma monospora TaxID=43982 RepID=A0ACB5T9L5_AMBMO|nr:unnamed protein product [Ambrosiozyma monospora]
MNALDISWKEVADNKDQIKLQDCIVLIDQIEHRLNKKILSKDYHSFLIEFCLDLEKKDEKITKEEFEILFEKLFQFTIQEALGSDSDTSQYTDPTESIKLETRRLDRRSQRGGRTYDETTDEFGDGSRVGGYSLNDQFERLNVLKDILRRRKQLKAESDSESGETDLTLELKLNEKLVSGYESLLEMFKANNDNNVKLVDLEKLIQSQENLIDQLSANLSKNKKKHAGWIGFGYWSFLWWVRFMFVLLICLIFLSYVLSFADELPRLSRNDYGFVDNLIIDCYELFDSLVD